MKMKPRTFYRVEQVNMVQAADKVTLSGGVWRKLSSYDRLSPWKSCVSLLLWPCLMMLVISWECSAGRAPYLDHTIAATRLCGLPWGRHPRPISGVTPGIIAHFVRGYWFAPEHPRTGPGLLEHWRRPLQWLYQKRLDVDYDIRPVTSTTAVRAVDIAAQVCQEIQQRSGGLAP